MSERTTRDPESGGATSRPRTGARAAHRLHLSACADLTLAALEVREQAPPEAWAMKPRGLWYAIGDAWREWCAEEQPAWLPERYPYAYRVRLRRGARVRRLSTPLAVRAFAARYRNAAAVAFGLSSCSIDWRAVAAEWDGIECAPYFSSLRWEPDLLWYYGLDVPSGCVWSPRAVAAIERVELLDVASREAAA